MGDPSVFHWGFPDSCSRVTPMMNSAPVRHRFTVIMYFGVLCNDVCHLSSLIFSSSIMLICYLQVYSLIFYGQEFQAYFSISDEGACS
jgi:hypothetical protein